MDECASCGSNVPENRLKIVTPGPGYAHKEPVKMCTLCLGSTAGNAFLYPDLKPYRENATVLQCIAQVGNMILDELER